MSHPNGTKAMLFSVLIAVALALSGWALMTAVEHGQRIASAETKVDGIVNWLRRVEDKLDRALER